MSNCVLYHVHKRSDVTSNLHDLPQVGGALASYAVERLAAGGQHVCVLAAPSEPQLRRPSSGLAAPPPAPTRVVLAWGRGGQGQLGSGAAVDSVVPHIVSGGLKGRHILQVLQTQMRFQRNHCFEVIRRGIRQLAMPRYVIVPDTNSARSRAAGTPK